MIYRALVELVDTMLLSIFPSTMYARLDIKLFLSAIYANYRQYRCEIL